MVRRLGGLVALCLLGACGGDNSPTGGGTPDGNGNPPDNEGNGNSGPIFEENSTSLEVVAVEAPDTLHSGSQPVLFAATVQDSAQFAEQIEHYFNVDSFLKLMAINTVLVNLDSYFGTGHNYYLYHDTRTDQYNMIPWDLNEAFGNFQQGQTNRLLDMDINHPSIGRRMLVERLLIIEDYRFEYHRNLQALIDIEFHPETMALEIDRLANLIQEAVVADQHKQFSTRMFEQSLSEDLSPRDQGRRKHQRGDNRRNRRPPPPMLDVIFGLKTFVERRVESIDSQLNGRRTGKILEPMRRPRPKEQRPFQ